MKRKRKWRGYLAAVLLIGVMLAGCRRTGGDVNSGDTGSMAGDTMTSTETEAAASEETGSETESRQEQVMANESETELQRVSETEKERAVDPIVLVLDPGHDSEYCTRNHPDLGVNEQDLNLTIAAIHSSTIQACRAR